MGNSFNLDQINERLSEASPDQVMEWSLQTFGNGLVLSTSFGIHSAVMLHLATQHKPDIPVIWIDTGYLPPETHDYAEQLTRRLNLNLQVFRSHLSPARMEALHGKLWEEKTVSALNLYDQIRKIEPMQRALEELEATAWLAGLRRGQTKYRQTLKRIELPGKIYKVHPLLPLSSADMENYMKTFNLPRHPLSYKGYKTVGDWHSSRPLSETDRHERETRFHGLKQECGLHLCSV